MACEGINKKTGKLKKGYKFAKRSKCPVKVHKKAKRSKR